MVLSEPFQQTEENYVRLRQQVAAGQLTREQLEAKLKEMMIQDAQGRYWTIGAESGKWYVYSGQNWVEAKPPAAVVGPANGQTISAPETKPRTGAGREVRRFEGHNQEVTSVAFSPNGRYLLSADREGSIRLWDAEKGQEVRRLMGPRGSVDCVAFSPQGRYAATGSDYPADKTIRIWEVESGQEIRRLSGHTDAVRGVAFSPDGRRLLSGSEDKTVRLWDIASGREQVRMAGHDDWVVGIAFSPDGRHALSASQDTTVRLWDLDSGREVKRYPLDAMLSQLMSGVAYSPNGRSALFCTLIGIQVWDLEDGREIGRFENHPGNVFAAVFSPDGRHALSCSGSDYVADENVKQSGKDNTVRLWDVTSREELARLEGHTGNVTSVAFSPDAAHAVSGSRDKTVRLWSLPT